MKKMNKHIWAALAAGIAAVVIGFAGCSNPSSTETTEQALQGTVSISGTAKVGETLSANTSGISNGVGTTTYQWKADGQNIAGATGATYVLTNAENGKIITLTVSYSGNTGALTSSATTAVQPSDPTKEALQGTVSINGTAKVGETLSANTNGISNASGTATYQWKANGQNISGATSAMYVLTSAENGKTITLVVSYSGNTGSITSSATGTVQPEEQAKDPLQGTVAISGTAKVGETLSANTSGISNGVGTATYQWKADGQNIAGATGATYVLTNAENGKTITVVVSYSGNNGSVASNPTSAALPSDPTKEALQGTVAINGTAKVGETLSANTNGISNGVGTATYQWKADGQNISGATSATYVLTSAENGGIITVVVSYSGNTGSITSSATGTVQPEEQAKDPLQGTVSISGTAKVGETLSANTSGISNGVGTAIYQWKANGQNIAGATSAAYILTSAENGKTITLTVSYSGNTGSITSGATAAVQPENTGGVYAVLADKFPVFQDAGVSDAEMTAAYANLTSAYNNLVANKGIPNVLDGKITEIHIFSVEKNYTWDPVNKILGIHMYNDEYYYSERLNRVFNGTINPYAQVINPAEETVHMAVVPQQDGNAKVPGTVFGG